MGWGARWGEGGWVRVGVGGRAFLGIRFDHVLSTFLK